MSSRRSSTTEASTLLTGVAVRRASSTGRTTSPTRSGKTMLQRKPIAVADTSGRKRDVADGSQQEPPALAADDDAVDADQRDGEHVRVAHVGERCRDVRPLRAWRHRQVERDHRNDDADRGACRSTHAERPPPRSDVLRDPGTTRRTRSRPRAAPRSSRRRGSAPHRAGSRRLRRPPMTTRDPSFQLTRACEARRACVGARSRCASIASTQMPCARTMSAARACTRGGQTIALDHRGDLRV